MLVPKTREYKKIKFKIKNNYLNSNINDENMSFVYTFSKLLNIKDNFFVKAMTSFKGLPHRFEIFIKKKGITFINDSKATSFFTAASLAVSSLKKHFLDIRRFTKKAIKLNYQNIKKK